MNVQPSVYCVSAEGSSSPPSKKAEPAAPPKPQPRTTVSRPSDTVPAPRTTVPRQRLTVGALREAKAAASTNRIPAIPKGKEPPAVPARDRLKKKTVAFGVTVNLSQTVEKEKEKDPVIPCASAPTSTRPMAATRTSFGTGAASRCAGLAPSRLMTGGGSGGQDENRDPRGEEEEKKKEEMGMKYMLESLNARIVDLEKREKESLKREEVATQRFEKLAKVVGKLAQRIEELEGQLKGRGGMRRRGESMDKEEEEMEDSRSRRRLYETESGGRRGGGGEGSGRKKMDRGLLDDEETIRALTRQLQANPMLRRTVQDAIDQDRYDHEYGDKRADTTTATTTRRRQVIDDFDEPRAPSGRVAVPAPRTTTNQRWRDDGFRRVTPPRGGGGGMERGGGGGSTRRRDGTPSRRRVTERVTMERVHHFDDSDVEEEEVYETRDHFDTRYDSDEYKTQYRTEFVDDYESVVQPQPEPRHAYTNNRRANQTFGGFREAGPTITEMSDSEDRMEQKRRELRERRLAKEAREGRK